MLDSAKSDGQMQITVKLKNIDYTTLEGAHNKYDQMIMHKSIAQNVSNLILVSKRIMLVQVKKFL